MLKTEIGTGIVTSRGIGTSTGIGAGAGTSTGIGTGKENQDLPVWS